ncbi:MAG TPA: hypothetical protein VF594_12090 [Rubricoccaceae bacterium]|jgi:molybdopterin converting factor small subunit
MEPDATSRAVAPPPTEWRALSRLRERVEAAVREIERLRADNAALAARVAELQEGLGDESPALVLPGAGDPDVLRARVQGFIDALDEVLAAPDVLGSEADAPPAPLDGQPDEDA